MHKLKTGEKERFGLHLPEQAYACVTAAIFTAFGNPVLFVTAHPETAKRRFDQIRQWIETENELHFFPEIDILFSGLIADPSIRAERSKVFSILSAFDNRASENHAHPLIVTSALSLANRSISKEQFKSRCFEIKPGMEIPPLKLVEKLETLGYEFNDIVEMPGMYGRRGGIVDIFANHNDFPVRIEFSGNTIDCIRQFDPRTQRSVKTNGSVTMTPVSEIDASGSANILDYLPENALVIIEDEEQVESEIEKIEQTMKGPEQSKEAESNDINSYFSLQEIECKLDKRRQIIEFQCWKAEAGRNMSKYIMNINPAPNYAAKLQVFLNEVPGMRARNKRIVLVSQQADRIRELMEERDIFIPLKSMLEATPEEGAFILIHGSIDGGWRIGEDLLLLTDLELFGLAKQRRLSRGRPVRHHLYLEDINIGDYVVHIEYGIGRFAGVKRLINDNVQKDYLVLEYACGDMLYIPAEQIDRVSLYVGGGERIPSLSRLGTQEWNRAQQRVKESVADIAQELVDLYAARGAKNGTAFSPDTLWQQELEASFQYVETPDQLEAVKAVKEDMESSKPMDRLVCGDVGYGKTEVALRAAFKAVMDGKQVAVLVPTTILAQQHMDTFSERLRAFPIRVAMLSRFCSQKEQAETIEKLNRGAIDICIGTHRLLQKDILFKDLGLVIIDEEQRFGVAHKEHFKKMRQAVDVLTLSATPIPRTLHMSLSGIRDMSTIETPPEDRSPIATFVGEMDGKLIREAILREMERDGQVFVVHNKVLGIHNVAEKVTRLVPEARISIAHGQMEEEKLESVMADFIAGKTDVLVTTTIIESGLDIPNVNTLIVDKADKLGLTQLYQLRGRVGRGANTAYAYFLFDSAGNLSDRGRERLKTIEQATELGAGFTIAMKDLEIRGAGNLLGVEQSGHIAAVGFNYYCQLLAEAVEEIRAKQEGRDIKKKEDLPPVSIDLQLPAFIPEFYVENVGIRFNIYRRLTNINNGKMLEDIKSELVDRFGPVPDEVENLLYIVGLKQIAANAGIESIFRRDDDIVISFNESGAKRIKFASQSVHESIKVGNRQARMDILKAGEGWMEVLRKLLETLAR
ncbi:MAG: transcription-repair coupling factor [Dehalococcoidia bacterium]|nr:transcription-repair coupling factor [Dehalococcoidia bacterium]MDD5493263.1 transcription-repair coupling factor [Dehalococcoidia bacterium]